MLYLIVLYLLLGEIVYSILCFYIHYILSTVPKMVLIYFFCEVFKAIKMAGRLPASSYVTETPKDSAMLITFSFGNLLISIMSSKENFFLSISVATSKRVTS